MTPIAAACKARAAANYERFDTFVECYGDEEWDEFVIDHSGKPMTKTGAFAMMNTMASIWDERRQDVINSAF